MKIQISQNVSQKISNYHFCDLLVDNDLIIANCVDELNLFIESDWSDNNKTSANIGNESDVSIDESILNNSILIKKLQIIQTRGILVISLFFQGKNDKII